MRKLLIIVGCLISYFAQGQTIQFLGSPTTQIYVRGQMRVDTVFYLPLRDTTFTPAQVGAVIVKSSNQIPYVWTGTKWSLFVVGSVNWGTITGTLSSQTDIQTALNAKQGTVIAGYGIKETGSTLTFDSANVRKVDTLIRTNDSTITYTINGVSHTLLIRGNSGGGISSLVLTVPTGVFSSPVTFSGAPAWAATLNLLTQSANTFFTGPPIGSAATPGFRAMVTADLPTGIPNGNLANPSINLAAGTAGSVPGWTTASVTLGGTATYNDPLTSGTNTGVVTPAMFNFWNAKVDSTIQSNDSIYEFRNSARFFRYLISPAGVGLTSLNGLTAGTQTFAIGSAGTAPAFVSSGSVHTLNVPFASSSSVTLGGLSNADYKTFIGKQRVFNVVSMCGADSSGVSDATAAIQACVLLAYADSGGIVYFPNGTYLIGGALQTSVGGVNPNCQIYIPPNNFNPAAPGGNSNAITFLGESPPAYDESILGFTAVPTHAGVILKSTITGSGTFPSVIGSRGNIGPSDFTFVNIQFENIQIQVKNSPAGPTVSGVNASYFINSDFRDMRVDVDTPLVNSVLPTNEIFGIATAKTDGGTMNNVTNVAISGFKYALVFGEHANVDNFQAFACWHALCPTLATYGSHVKTVHINWCKDLIYSGFGGVTGIGASVLDIDNLQSEIDTASGNWWKLDYMVNDSLLFITGRGKIDYRLRGGGKTLLFPKNGGTGMVFQNLESANFVGSNDNLGNNTLVSNDHLFNGKINFGTAGNAFYDEGLQRFGIGNNSFSPAYPIHIQTSLLSATGVEVETLVNTSAAEFANKNNVGDLGQFSTTGDAFPGTFLAPRQTSLVTSAPNGLNLLAYDAAGFIDFGTAGFLAANRRMRIDALGSIMMNTTSNHHKVLSINGGIWGNKDSLPLSSAGSVVALGIDTSTGLFVRSSRDSSNLLPYNYYGGFFPSGDTVIPFGHSYVFGANATTPAQRYSSVFCNSIGAIELNMGVSGSTVMRQDPVDYQGAQSFVERMTSIPPYSFHNKFIWFDGGLNDAGQTAAAYTTANYIAAWDSVMNYVINTLGYPKKRIAILGVEFIGQAGLTYYGTVTGNAAPTYARMRQFDSCNRATTLKWGTLFVPMYDKILFNDTTLLGGTGTVHPTDSGYAYMANLMLQKTGLSVSSPFVQSGNNITAKVINSNLVMGSQTPASVTTPNFLSLGAQFSSASASPGKAKLKFYDDGTANNTFGFGISSSSFEYFGGGAGTSHLFYINGDATPYMKITPTGLVVPHSGAANVTIGDHTIASSLLVGDHTLTSTATPGVVDAGGTFSNSPGDSSKAKIITYSNGTSYAGLGFSLSGLEYYAPFTTPHQFYYRSAVRFQVGDSTLITNVHAGNSAMAVMVYNRTSSAVDTVPASTFGGGVTTVGSFSGSSIANGASISGSAITFGPTDGTNPGMVTTGTQTIAGAKTFSGGVAASNYATTGSSPASPTLGAGVPTTGGASSGFGSGSNSVSGSWSLTTGTGTSTPGGTIATFVLPTSHSAKAVVFVQDQTAANPPVTAIMTDATHFAITLKTAQVLTTSTSYQWGYFIID